MLTQTLTCNLCGWTARQSPPIPMFDHSCPHRATVPMPTRAPTGQPAWSLCRTIEQMFINADRAMLESLRCK